MTDYGVDYVNKKILAIAKDLDIIAPGYEAKVYWNNNAKTKFLTQICIYIDKQKCIKLPLIDTNNVCCDEIIRMARDFLEAYEGSLNSKSEDFTNFINICLANKYKYELTKENEIIMSKKSAQEIEFEQFEAQKRAEADAEVAAYKANIDEEIEDKRRELREEQRQADANDKAAEFWYFYSGLLNNGFSEEQAMQILLAVSKK